MAASTEMIRLMKKKDDIEDQIKALNEVLDSQQSVGMSGPLVDTEGFPRGDIDIQSVRYARHEIICLQNDHVAVMKEVEEELYRIHANARSSRSQEMETDASSAETVVMETERLPIGTINKIDDGSPAYTAGLKNGDSVLKFGSLSHENFQGLQNIASVVQHSIGKSIPITVRRGDQTLNLSIVPQRWHKDKGLLGGITGLNSRLQEAKYVDEGQTRCNLLPQKKET